MSVTRARRHATAICAGSILVLLVGCGALPQSVVTRLPSPVVTLPASALPDAAASAASPSPSPGVPTGAASTPSPDPTDPAPGSSLVSCGDGGSATVDGADRSVRVQGRCATLSVAGPALIVDASAATIAALTVAGDRVQVALGGADAITVQGNDTRITSSAGVRRVDLSGDRSTVTIGGAIGSVVIRGQSNAVRATGSVGASDVQGRGNTVDG